MRPRVALLEPKPTSLIASASRWLANRELAIVHEGELSLSGDQILIGRQLVCLRSSVEFAYVTQDPEAGTILRVLSDPDRELAVAPDDARSALEAIDLGPAHSVMAFDYVKIGADAITTGGHIIQYDDVVSARVADEPDSDETIAIELRDARDYLLSEFRAFRKVARDLVERIEHAIAVRAALKTDVDRTALSRNDRDYVEWIESLRVLTSSSGGYREAVLSEDDLAAVMMDPTVRPIERAAAAIAVARTRPELLRAACRATALNNLRIALEDALRHNDTRLVAALRRLEGA
jgi:hypothetical protein